MSERLNYPNVSSSCRQGSKSSQGAVALGSLRPKLNIAGTKRAMIIRLKVSCNEQKNDKN